MEKIILTAQLRSDTGKKTAKKLRKEGLLPAVLYGGKVKTPLALTLDDHEVRQLFKSLGGEKNKLISLQVKENKGKPKEHVVLLREVQAHPYKDIIWHLDFYQVSLNKPIKVAIPLHIQGEPVGVKTDGGILDIHLRKIEIECLPDQMPEEITVDVSSLEIGNSLHVRDLTVPSEVTVLEDTDNMVLAVIEPTKIVEEVAEEEEAAEGAEGEGAEEAEKPEEAAQETAEDTAAEG